MNKIWKKFIRWFYCRSLCYDCKNRGNKLVCLGSNKTMETKKFRIIECSNYKEMI